MATQMVYDTERSSADGTVLVAAGSYLTDTYGPAREVMTSTGQIVRAWPHTRTGYDQGAPNGGIYPATDKPFLLPSSETHNAVTPDSAGITPEVIKAVATSTTGYAPIDGKAWNDPTSGWMLGAPTTSTDAQGNTAKTRYDARGKVVEERQPASTGTDAGTTRTIYYTATPNPEDASCGASATAKAWAGLFCVGSAALPALRAARVGRHASMTNARGSRVRAVFRSNHGTRAQPTFRGQAKHWKRDSQIAGIDSESRHERHIVRQLPAVENGLPILTFPGISNYYLIQELPVGSEVLTSNRGG